MVTGYNLCIDKNFSKFQDYVKIGENHLSAQKAKTTEYLQKYIVDGVADGTKLKKDWFPEINADIFISHSHADEKLAKGLAGWLHNIFELNCFIDSCVWGYSNELLDMIKDINRVGEIMYIPYGRQSINDNDIQAIIPG